MSNMLSTEPVARIRVLIIEDDVADLAALQTALADLDAEVVSARSGREALDLAARRRFEVVLIDIRMPSMDGLVTARLLREVLANGKQHVPPIIFMTSGDVTESLLLRGYSEGGVDFLFKPIKPEVVKSKVKVFADLGRREDGPRGVEAALREFNEMLLAARDRAIEAGEAKSLFLANVSHELRTPLHAVLGYAELLHEELTAQGQRDLATDAARLHLAAEHLLDVVNGILDLAKIESGRMELHIEEFEIEPLVHRVVDTLAHMSERKGNALHVEIARDVGVMRSDAAKVRQVLYNLLSNAVKFTDHGSIVLQVLRESNMEIPCITFRIEDTGTGIDPKDFPRLFREFTQLDASTTRRHGGTGLGLAICERFCRMLGGSIAVDSEPGLGSVFTAKLPAIVSHGECRATPGYSPA